jgi:hypothetical protein
LGRDSGRFVFVCVCDASEMSDVCFRMVHGRIERPCWGKLNMPILRHDKTLQALRYICQIGNLRLCILGVEYRVSREGTT